MLPIPIIALLILLTDCEKFKIDSKKLALFAKISILIAFILYLLQSNGYLIVSNALGDRHGLNRTSIPRLELFSGNPIPFSTAVFGITIFSFVAWRTENYKEKLITITSCIIGFYLAGVLSGSRGTLMAIILSVPILIWFISRSFMMLLSLSLVLIVIGYFIKIFDLNLLDIKHMERIFAGIETLFQGMKNDPSIMLRMDLWKAATKSLEEMPFFGYDVSNRFTALKLIFQKTLTITIPIHTMIYWPV